MAIDPAFDEVEAETTEAPEGDDLLLKYLRDMRRPVCRVLKKSEEIKLAKFIDSQKIICRRRLIRLVGRSYAGRDPHLNILAQRIKGLKRSVAGQVITDEIASGRLLAYFKICRQTEAVRAFNKMVSANLRFVVFLCKKQWNRSPTALLDHIEDGNIGLMRAVATYDHHQSRFTTYASWWINNAVRHGVRNSAGPIRLPSYLHDLSNKLAGIQKNNDVSVEEAALAYVETMNDDPNMIEGSAAKVVKKAGYARAALTTQLSLDSGGALNEDGVSSMYDFLEDKGSTGPEEVVASSLRRERMFQIMHAVLNERELCIIADRFGLSDVETKTFHQLAKKWKCSRERIRQIEAKALEKLRRHLRYLND